MNTRNIKTKLLIGASLLTAVLCVGCSCKEGKGKELNQIQPGAEQPELVSKER